MRPTTSLHLKDEQNLLNKMRQLNLKIKKMGKKIQILNEPHLSIQSLWFSYRRMLDPINNVRDVREMTDKSRDAMKVSEIVYTVWFKE